MKTHALTKNEWTQSVQRRLLDAGWAWDDAIHFAHELAELFEWESLTPAMAIERAERCSRVVGIAPDASSGRVTHG